MPRASRKARGRADHGRQVEKVKEASAAAGLVELLEGIAADPEAGPWAGWAERMLHADKEKQKPKGRER
jgi:hypothetical protein